MNAAPALNPVLRAAALASLAWACTAPTAWGVDTREDPPRVATPAPLADPLGAAREALAAKRYAQALAELQRMNADGRAAQSADWQNLMGYSLRKNQPADLARAQTHYEAALRLQPQHKGALAYSGELALMQSDLPRAQRFLAQLRAACPNGCEEQQQLQREIARFQANGNRFIATW